MRTQSISFAPLLRQDKHIKVSDLGCSSKSPNGAILLHSPGRKPWVICFHTFLELRRSGTFPTNRNDTRQMLALLVPLLKELILLLPCIPRVAFRALPSFHPGLCRNVVPTALIKQKFSILNANALSQERLAYQ